MAYTSWVELLMDRAAVTPDRVAYQFLGDGENVTSTLTYGALDRRARAGARYLHQFMDPGARLVLMYPAGLDFLVGFFSCLYAGVVAVPAVIPRTARSLPRFLAMWADCQPQGLLTDPATQALVQPLIADRSEPIPWFNLDGTEDITWQPDPTVQPIVFLQYTSGSTGNPKGVMLSHANLLYNVGLIGDAVDRTAADHLLCWLPAFHDWGLIGFLLQALYVGSPCTFMDPASFLQKPLRWLTAISRYRATFTGAPNFAYELCLKQSTPAQRAELDLSCLQVALVGAEPVHSETLRQFTATFGPCGLRPQAFFPCYGLAESTLWVSGGAVTDLPMYLEVDEVALQQHRVVPGTSRILVSSGPAAGDHQVLIVHSATQTPCACDQIGEVWVAGSSVAGGYWRRRAEDFQGFLQDGRGPFLKTGDLGFLHEGELYITGRCKDLIIIAGRNYYPQDIEHTVETSHPSLRQGYGACFSIELGTIEQLVILQELNLGQRPDLTLVIAQIQRSVALTHGLSAAVIMIVKAGTIPKTSSGKVMRYACKTLFLNQQLPVLASWQLPGLKS